LAQWIRVLYLGGHSGDQRRVTKAYGDALARLGHAADNGDGLTEVRTLSEGSVRKGEARRLAGVVSSARGDDLLPRDAIHQLQARIQSPVTRIVAKDRSSTVRAPCAGVLILTKHCTMAIFS
jgi:hypothetical protein